MSFGTYLFCELYFNKETYETKEQVQSDLDEVTSYIKDLETRLVNYGIMTEPDKFIKTEEEVVNLVNVVQSEINAIIEQLEESYIDRYKLNLLLDNWDACHTPDGKAITPKFDEGKYTAFMSGDFVPDDREEDEE